MRPTPDQNVGQVLSYSGAKPNLLLSSPRARVAHETGPGRSGATPEQNHGQVRVWSSRVGAVLAGQVRVGSNWVGSVIPGEWSGRVGQGLYGTGLRHSLVEVHR